jgi:hypothetical protein
MPKRSSINTAIASLGFTEESLDQELKAGLSHARSGNCCSGNEGPGCDSGGFWASSSSRGNRETIARAKANQRSGLERQSLDKGCAY